MDHGMSVKPSDSSKVEKLSSGATRATLKPLRWRARINGKRKLYKYQLEFATSKTYGRQVGFITTV